MDVVCPHCNSRRIVSAKVPKDVVMVVPCPSCMELVVLFRKKIIPLDKTILEQGTQEERKMHLAGIIAEFLEPGVFKLGLAMPRQETAESRSVAKGADFFSEEPISDNEVERFVSVQLNRLDDSRYFRRHFE